MVELRASVRQLPGDLATLYLAAVAMSDSAPFLSRRLEHAGEVLQRHPRTLQRRLRAADELMAEILTRRAAVRAGESAVMARGWSIVEFSSRLRLGREPTEFVSRRRIRVVVPELTEVTDLFSLPASSADAIEVEALSGCTLTEVRRTAESVWQLRLALPRPLKMGEEHDLALVVRVGNGHPLPPHAVLAPSRACAAFDVTVETGDSGAHDFVRLDGVPLVVLGDEHPSGTPVEVVDGTAHCAFTDLTPGMAYGLVWSRSED